MARIASLLLAATVIVLAGCGGGGSTSSGSSGSGAGAAGAQAVTIQDFSFRPADITVPKGTTVSFANKDSTPHTATSKQSGVFDSGSIDPGKTGSVTLEKTGSFSYYCVFHPFMKGTITVE